MKFLIVGLGSMGKRRIRNLNSIGFKDIIGFDKNQERCDSVSKEYKITAYHNLETALDQKPTAMIISTPPDLHMIYAKKALEEGMHFFCEAGVLTKETEEVLQKLKKSGLVGMPSCTMMQHPIVVETKKILESNKLDSPLAFIYHSGQYLPDWHPWEDYREFYVSKRKTGGCREIIPFELSWLTSIFGEITSVMGQKAKTSDLETDIDDIYNVLIKFTNNIQGNLIVDVLSQPAYRQLKVICEGGILESDWISRTIKYYKKDDGWTEIKVDDGKPQSNYIYGEKPYVEEMKIFTESILENKKLAYQFSHDLQILKVLESIDDSSNEGTLIYTNNSSTKND